MWTDRLTLDLFIVSVFCACRCLATDTCELARYEEPGDIQFAVILSMRQPEVNQSCGQASYASLQLSMAVKYAVDKLNTPDQNGNSFIPGVKIGFKLFNDCGHDKYALISAAEVIEAQLPPEIGVCDQNSPHPIFAGFIGPSRSHNAIAVSDVLKGTTIPLIGIATTLSELSDKSLYPNILRTVVSDNKQSKAIVSLVKNLNWTVVAILHTTDIYGRDLAKAVQKLAPESQVCVIHFEAVPDIGNLNRAIETLLKIQQTTKSNSLGVVFLGYQEMVQNLIRNLETHSNRDNIARLQWIFPDSVGRYSLPLEAAKINTQGDVDIVQSVWSVSPMSSNLQEFGDYVQSEINDVSIKRRNSTNPWVSAFVADMCPEHFPGPGCLAFEQSGYVPATIHAVYALTSAIKSYHTKICSGASGICQVLQRKFSINLLSEVQNVSFAYSDFGPEHTVPEFVTANVSVSFDDNGDIRQRSGQEVYSINKYVSGKFDKVGSFTNDGTMDLSSMASELSLCGDGCQACVHEPAFVYLPGDILLAGFLSIHWYPEKDQFGCGIFRNEVHTIISVEGFLYAIKKMNKETGLKFGAVIFDDCYNSLKMNKIVSTYFSGDVPLIDPVTEQVIDLTKVVGIIGSESSAVSLPLAEAFTKLNKPIISPASTSADYDDKGLYPYSLRTVVSDSGTIGVIFEIAKHFGWKYISIIYSNNNYGIKAVKLFREMTSKEELCYAEPIPISLTPDEKPMIDIVKKIIANKAKVVVYIGLEEDMKRFQKTIKDNKLEVVYLGLEDWAVNGKPYPGTARQTAGSIVVIPVSPRLPWDDFPAYMVTRKPVWSKASLWFDRFWQAKFQCHLPGRFENNLNTVCDESLRFSMADARGWSRQFRVSNTINAVAAMIKGVVTARTKLCLYEGSEEFACETFRQNPGKVTKYIREVRLGAGSDSYRPFQDDGNGNGDFAIDNLQKLPSGEYEYVEVGKFHVTDKKLVMYPGQDVQFYFNGERVDNVDWSCNSPEICKACNNKSSGVMPVMATQGEYQGDSIQQAILGVVCVVLLFVLVMIVLLVVLKFRRRPKKIVNVNGAAYYGAANGLVHGADVTARSTFPRIENERGAYNSTYMSDLRSSVTGSLDFDIEETDSMGRDPSVQRRKQVDEDPYLHATPSASPPQSSGDNYIGQTAENTVPKIIDRESHQSSGGNSMGQSTQNTIPKTIDREPRYADIDVQTTPKTIHNTLENRYSSMPHASEDTSDNRGLPETPVGGDNTDLRDNSTVMSQIDLEQTTVKTSGDNTIGHAAENTLPKIIDRESYQSKEDNSIEQSAENTVPKTIGREPRYVEIDVETTPKTVHVENESLENRYSSMPHTSDNRGLPETPVEGDNTDFGDNSVMPQTDVEQTTVKNVDDSVIGQLDGPDDERYTDYNELNNVEHDSSSQSQSSSEPQNNEAQRKEKRRPPPLPVKTSKLLRRSKDSERESTL